MNPGAALRVAALLFHSLALPGQEVVALLPFGKVPEAQIRLAEAALAQGGLKVRRLPERPLPPEAWTAPRRRWRAEILLAWLGRERPRDCRYAVGLCAEDISTTLHGYPDWGIFGLAELGGRSAVVSSHRLRRPGHPLPERLDKVLRHELGHLQGLPHCPGVSCLMADAEGSLKGVDASPGQACPRCRGRLAAR